MDAGSRREGLPGRDLIGGKAWSVARMQALGLEVPPAFVITTEACTAFLATGAAPARLEAGNDEGVAWLEAKTGRILERSGPLLVLVRSGAPFMPGMMDTVLNVGTNDLPRWRSSPNAATLVSPAIRTKRFLDLYSHVVLNSTAPNFDPGRPRPGARRSRPSGGDVPAGARKQLR